MAADIADEGPRGGRLPFVVGPAVRGEQLVCVRIGEGQEVDRLREGGVAEGARGEQRRGEKMRAAEEMQLLVGEPVGEAVDDPETGRAAFTEAYRQAAEERGQAGGGGRFQAEGVGDGGYLGGELLDGGGALSAVQVEPEDAAGIGGVEAERVLLREQRLADPGHAAQLRGAGGAVAGLVDERHVVAAQRGVDAPLLRQPTHEAGGAHAGGGGEPGGGGCLAAVCSVLAQW
jgi:hypothetical protein